MWGWHKLVAKIQKKRVNKGRRHIVENPKHRILKFLKIDLLSSPI